MDEDKNLSTILESKLPNIHKEIEKLEQVFLEFPQVDCPVRHIFGPGVYIREVTLPAGAFCIGHHQNLPHFNVMLKGKVKVYQEDGTSKVLTAPMSFMAPPGRKIGYVLEEVVWQNVYPTDEQDVEKLEEKYLTKTPYSQDWLSQRLLACADKYREDKDDYELMLQELGITEEQIQLEVQRTDNRIELPPGNYKFATGPSMIHGKGVFATATIACREVIGPAGIGGKRTVLGTTVNHSKNPSAKVIVKGNNLYLVAVRELQGMKAGVLGEEITTDYRRTVDVVKRLEHKE